VDRIQQRMAGLLASLATLAEGHAASRNITVFSLNFACRDAFPYEGCDNCQTRFDMLADAFRGEWDGDYLGFPDLSEVDVIMAQEISYTSSEDSYEQISSALADRGFIYRSGTPAPSASDPMCANPPAAGFWWNTIPQQLASAVSGYESGALVTFSRWPILSTMRQKWCRTQLPSPAGYLAALLDVNGTAVVAINLHAFPEYDAGITADDVRTYQFSELAGFANSVEAALRLTGAAFSVVLGGDFNEDAYHRQHTNASVDCSLINFPLVIDKFASMGLDIVAACLSGAIGQPTWDQTNNELAGAFTGHDIHQVLDYLFVQSSSEAARIHAASAKNEVRTLRTAVPWNGTFCESDVLGTIGRTYTDSFHALTDHNAVVASFDLPPATTTDASLAAAAFAEAVLEWRTNAGAQQAACGQEGTQCAIDANCCDGEHSYYGRELSCKRRECQA